MTMPSVEIQNFLKQILAQKLNTSVTSIRFEGVGGGSINETFRVIAGNENQFFLKLNSASDYPGLFVKEKQGLEYLSKQKILRVPEVIACEIINNQQFLLLEWIEHGIKNPEFWKEFGTELAMLHQITHHSFGFYEDNYMGALIQVNSVTPEWISFFIQNRLQPQIDLAESKHRLGSKQLAGFERLYPRLPQIFNKEAPSLLHGDLWSGNYMCDGRDQPVLIDPAVYFGHRSVDLGMTTLFGGFDNQFYDAYAYHSPFPSNYREQWDVANLYPLLIHLNLFGSSYLTQIDSILKKFQ